MQTSDEKKRKRASYMRDWRRKNNDHYRKYKRDYYRKNKTKMHEQNRKSSQKRKLEIFTHYGGNPPRCNCCDETIYEFLTIDHINGGGIKHRKSIGGIGGTRFYQWLKNNNFPKGFQVLCANCNQGSALNGGVCPHENKKI